MSAIPSKDPLLDFVTEWASLAAQVEDQMAGDVEPFWREHVSPCELIARDGPLPDATTAAGAAAALKMALSFDDMEDQDANLVRAALSYLRGLPA